MLLKSSDWSTRLQGNWSKSINHKNGQERVGTPKGSRQPSNHPRDKPQKQPAPILKYVRSHLSLSRIQCRSPSRRTSPLCPLSILTFFTSTTTPSGILTFNKDNDVWSLFNHLMSKISWSQMSDSSYLPSPAVAFHVGFFASTWFTLKAAAVGNFLKSWITKQPRA
jgi:hypothetical protein